MHSFHKNRAVQESVGQHFVEVAREVVDVGDAGVTGKEKLALRHDARRRKQAAGVEAALAAHVPQQPGCGGKVQRHQRVFESDLEGSQPAARHKGDGQQVRRQKEQPVQRGHQHQHRRAVISVACERVAVLPQGSQATASRASALSSRADSQ